jgi:hypothetical protein
VIPRRSITQVCRGPSSTRLPERIVEGAIVITGDAEDPVFARVASLTERPTGVKVHLEILPGDPLEYAEAMRRTHLLSA